MVNRKTWYAHMFRTKGGTFGFPYELSGNQVERAKKMARDLFFNNKWEKQVKPLSWLLDKFAFEAKRTGRAKQYKIWKDDNHAIDLTNNSIDICAKINYIHMNPVKARWVDNPEDYLYSSAIDYANGKGMVSIELV